MILAKSLTERFVAATQNPVDDFAFAHSVEIVHAEIFFDNHGVDDVTNELKGSACVVAAIGFESREGKIDKFFADVLVGES